nr:MAG TPA: vesicle-associated membrane protein 2 [Caudoviricetes sp.]
MSKKIKKIFDIICSFLIIFWAFFVCWIIVGQP